MIFIQILIGIFVVSLIGFLGGFMLAFFAKIFEVKKDERIDQIIKILPGVNCGACGYPGCAGYAEAIIEKDVDINLCSAGGQNVVDNISNLLGKAGEAKLKYVAKVKCLGDDAIAKKDYIFNGEEDCSVVYSFFQGEKACKYGCVGKGDCIKVCPVNAIKRDELNRVWVDENLCIGCEKCVAVCPTKVIQMVPIDGGYFVACSSHYNGKIVKDICKKGCIGCKICEKVTNDLNRIYVDNNLAIIKYDSKTDLKEACLKCPAMVIVPIINQSKFIKEGKKG
ncbi:MAG TPA: RnfABCDGE type electron transport complex subunit B [Spirochaetota bacterium]|nr:RnfABCDGE type electron transport complex subunit B [Spirochaetota bacterium]HPP04738.1 RnfABCDGE type electron transport complex subunit B [Spirochaetota bacterium]